MRTSSRLGEDARRSVSKKFGQKLGINRQALLQLEALGARPGLQLCQVRPRTLGIDEVRRKRRNPAPVIDSSVKQLFVIWIRKIRRRLDVYVWHEKRCNGVCPQLSPAAGLGPLPIR